MFQTFTATTDPSTTAPRVAALRGWMATQGVGGMLIPRADRFQGEYVAAHDERLAWLTGFTGSAGFACILADQGAVFIDGRYRLQVTQQVDTDVLTPVPWPEVKLYDWLQDIGAVQRVIGFDPWLHTASDVEALTSKGVSLRPVAGGVDAIWTDRPLPTPQPAYVQPLTYCGESVGDKRGRIAQEVAQAGATACVLTAPESICWLLNIRGRDIPRTPLVQAYAVLFADATLAVFSDACKFDDLDLDASITTHDWTAFEGYLATLDGTILYDPGHAPHAVADILHKGDAHAAPDPCLLPKATKNRVELGGARAAHLRDGAAMCRFLAWYDAAPKAALTEIDIVKALEGFRQGTGVLEDISFETIAGSGPNGAIVHYRVTEDSNRPLDTDSLLLVDSGGQYRDGTTDVTRTLPVGMPSDTMRQMFTRVLKGMIAISSLQFPQGLAGRDIDGFARRALWDVGCDYGHGTGHGVGSFLSVHEGPQRIAQTSDVVLLPGMIVSNEPGYYHEGAFGIRIENLIAVQEATTTDLAMLSFETLTLVPIAKALIVADMLNGDERTWLNAYHADVCARLTPCLDPATQSWLRTATAPL